MDPSVSRNFRGKRQETVSSNIDEIRLHSSDGTSVSLITRKLRELSDEGSLSVDDGFVVRVFLDPGGISLRSLKRD